MGIILLAGVMSQIPVLLYLAAASVSSYYLAPTRDLKYVPRYIDGDPAPDYQILQIVPTELEDLQHRNITSLKISLFLEEATPWMSRISETYSKKLTTKNLSWTKIHRVQQKLHQKQQQQQQQQQLSHLTHSRGAGGGRAACWRSRF